jgi:hypothetical protein
MMDDGEMAEAITFELNKGPWKALGLGLGEILFTNEDGERFLLTVTKVDALDDELAAV